MALRSPESSLAEIRPFPSHSGSSLAIAARPMTALRFQILGPVVARSRDQDVTPRAQKVRTLLATLLVHRNSVVSVDSLIGELWGEAPPRTALQALRVYVSQLRQSLDVGAPALLTTQPPGYRLEIGAGMLDLADWDRFCEGARHAQFEGNLELAGQLYRQALALWRGHALLDVRSGELLSGVALGLEDARIATIGRRIDIDLRLGRHLDVVAELRALTAQHKFDEGLHARLMIALHRSGRTIDALNVYGQARKALVEELGVEPSRQLQTVHRAVLSADYAALDQAGTWFDRSG